MRRLTYCRSNDYHVGDRPPGIAREIDDIDKIEATAHGLTETMDEINETIDEIKATMDDLNEGMDGLWEELFDGCLPLLFGRVWVFN